MESKNSPTSSKITTLEGTTLEVWAVHPDLLREQDINARVMDEKTMNRLAVNISNNKQLESLPYCYPTMSPGGVQEFSIISGHHRVRAARTAGLQKIFILVDIQDMTREQIVAKQLAHNSLNGKDDPQVLSALYAEIQDVERKLEAGIFDMEKFEYSGVSVDNLEFLFEYEQVMILFLKKAYNDFENIINKVQDLDTCKQIYLADADVFAKYREVIQKITKRNNVRNIAAIMTVVIDIVETVLKDWEQQQKQAKSKPTKISSDENKE